MHIFLFRFVFAICCCSVFGLSAQKPSSDEAPLEKALLWQIKGKGIRTSYLFGTIHIIDAERFFLPSGLERCLKKCKRLIFEIDFSNPLAMSMEIAVLAPMKGNKRLSDFYTPEEYAEVKNYLSNPHNQTGGALGYMPFDVLETWKPFFLQTMLSQDGTDFATGKTKSYEMELLSMTQARRPKMPLGGLETIADQIAVFDQIPYEQQARLLLETVRNAQSDAPSTEDEAAQIFDLYCNQDIEGMIALTGDSFKDMPGSEELLLDNRNRNWISRIKTIAAGQPAFFAVGAGHLAGKQGLIRLLRAEGLRLQPVRR